MLLKYREEESNETEVSFSGLDLFVLGERRDGDVKDVRRCVHTMAVTHRE